MEKLVHHFKVFHEMSYEMYYHLGGAEAESWGPLPGETVSHGERTPKPAHGFRWQRQVMS